MLTDHYTPEQVAAILAADYESDNYARNLAAKDRRAERLARRQAEKRGR